MNNEELKVLHNENHIHVVEKEYNGALITIANAVNAPLSFRIYSRDTQCQYIKLKCSGLLTSNETKIPFVGNAIEVTDYNKANLIVEGKYYVSDYIEYNCKTNESYRHIYIDDTLINYNISLKDQTQALLVTPVVEKINSTDEQYCFEILKTFQEECEVAVISDNQFVFEDFVAKGNYEDTINIGASNNTYQYLGTDEYLYFNNYFFCNCDYKFSYNTTGVGSIIVHFFDEANTNISYDVLKLIENGVYDANKQGIVVNEKQLKLLFEDNNQVERFRIGFKVQTNEFFSDLNFYKLNINNIYMDLFIKSIKDIDFNLLEFSRNGQYSGIEYINVTDADKIYKYIGEEEYLFYHLFIPYKSNYNFSYKINTMSEIIIRFYDKKKNNISSSINNILTEGYYDETKNGIILNLMEVTIPHIKETEIAYFQIGFKVEPDSYFSDLYLKKY